MSIFTASQTRSHVEREYMLLTPESHVPAPVAGWENTQTTILIGPRCGAKFVEYLVTLSASSRSAAPPNHTSRFIYVLDGTLVLDIADARHSLNQGGYVYLPPDTPHQLSSDTRAQIVVVEKPYVATQHAPKPTEVVVAQEQAINTTSVAGDPDVQVKTLLPNDLGFDMAMNIMAFKPGASLSLVEVHIMEHGLLMLDGTLIYRLSEHYYPVQRGDVIYMAPYCPQWCAAFGSGQARYLLYKDWNRDGFGY